jgi:hypothetical protein
MSATLSAPEFCGGYPPNQRQLVDRTRQDRTMWHAAPQTRARTRGISADVPIELSKKGLDMSEIEQTEVSALPSHIRKYVETSIRDRDVCALVRALRGERLSWIAQLRDVLQRHDLYERILVKAYRAPGEDHTTLTTEQTLSLLKIGDRQKLRSCGQPLPPGETFELFRGVAGEEPRRKTCGLSWTSSRPRACWFAWRLEAYRRLDPAVYSATFNADDIFVYTRDEQEFIAIPPVSPRRLDLSAEAIRLECESHQATIRVSDDDEL